MQLNVRLLAHLDFEKNMDVCMGHRMYLYQLCIFMENKHDCMMFQD